MNKNIFSSIIFLLLTPGYILSSLQTSPINSILTVRDDISKLVATSTLITASLIPATLLIEKINQKTYKNRKIDILAYQIQDLLCTRAIPIQLKIIAALNITALIPYITCVMYHRIIFNQLNRIHNNCPNCVNVNTFCDQHQPLTPLLKSLDKAVYASVATFALGYTYIAFKNTPGSINNCFTMDSYASKHCTIL